MDKLQRLWLNNMISLSNVVISSLSEDITMFKCNLAVLLAERAMNQSDLHRKTKIRPNTINLYYHNLVSRFNKADMIKICDALECKLSELIEYEPDKK